MRARANHKEKIKVTSTSSFQEPFSLTETVAIENIIIMTCALSNFTHALGVLENEKGLFGLADSELDVFSS